MSMLRLAKLIPDPNNIRRGPDDPEAIARMAASLEARGILSPILVRPSTMTADAYFIVFGHRRVAAARSLGWTEIAGDVKDLTDEQVTEIQAAENMARSAMRPVDQWRAMKRLQDGGLSIEQAAANCGLELRLARRLTWLGSMAPGVLDLISEYGLPDRDDHLRTIALAPAEVQARAIKASGAVTGKGKNRQVSWYKIAEGCKMPRISAAIALFDLDTVRSTVGLTFDEDLFAQPGSREQHTTADIKKFLTCQHAALHDQVERLKAKGQRVFIVSSGKTSPQGHGTMNLPQGWEMHSGIYDGKWPAIMDKPTEDRALALSVAEDGWSVGTVSSFILRRATAAKKPGKGQDSSGGAQATEDAGPRPDISKEGMHLIAQAQTSAFRDHLRGLTADDVTPVVLLAALVEALAARNVRIGNGTPYGVAGFEDILMRVVSKDESSLSTSLVTGAALDAIARIVTFDTPKVQGGSGPVAELLARALGPVPMPRFDTAEFLAQCSGARIRELARGAGFQGSKVSALREIMVGKLPDWRPTEAEFNASVLPAIAGNEDGEEAEAA